MLDNDITDEEIEQRRKERPSNSDMEL